MKENKNDNYEEGLFIILITVLVFGGLMIWNKLTPLQSEFIYEEYEEYSLSDYYEDDDVYIEEKETPVIQVTVTKYNPTVEQCDSDPLITADGSYIDTLKLNEGKLKWIAISRDLREIFHYGDTVVILTDSGEIDGEYIVHDTMNPRWVSRIDILSPKGDSLGKWDNVYMYKK